MLRPASESGRFEGHKHLVTNLAFSPDGRFIASACLDGFARLFDVATGRLLKVSGDGRPSTGSRDNRRPLAFTPDGARLATSTGDGTLAIWNVATGERVASLPADAIGYARVVFSPDSRWLATATGQVNGGGGKARLWDATTGSESRLEGTEGAMFLDLTFSPDSRYLAGGARYDGVKIWELPDGKLRRVLPGHSGVVRAISISPDGSAIAAAEETTISIWKFPQGTAYRVIRGHTELILSRRIQPRRPAPCQRRAGWQGQDLGPDRGSRSRRRRRPGELGQEHRGNRLRRGRAADRDV